MNDCKHKADDVVFILDIPYCMSCSVCLLDIKYHPSNEDKVTKIITKKDK